MTTGAATAGGSAAAAVAVTAAAVEAATGASTREDGGARATAAPLYPLTTSLFLVTALRAAIAIVAVAALSLVFANDRALILAFAGGAAIMTIAALARARGSAHFSLRGRADAWPAGAHEAPWPRSTLRAAYPSTMGLAALIAIAAPIDATLAALLAGFELGLGLMSLALGAENALWEARAGVLVASAPGLRAHFFVRPRT